MSQACACTTLVVEAATGPGGIQGRALKIHVWTEALLGFAGACQVRLGCFCAHTTIALDPLVDARCKATMAAASVTAIQNVLDGWIDVDALATTRNLYPVCQGRQGTMSPTGPTILRDVLIPADGAIVDAIF